MNRRRRCEPRSDGGVLDQELAARLNELISERDTDPMQSLWPAFRRIAGWFMGAAVFAAVLLIRFLYE
ncbi:hypothetical protein [Cupriavidus necator]|uniref:hypothetical protein n=1 Tax=Cupriavidus necator TaxID=106590 RepID=UPI00339D3113